MKYSNKESWRQNMWHEWFLSLVSLWTHSHNSVILPSFFSGLSSGWDKAVNACASQPMTQGPRHQVEELWEELSRPCSNKELDSLHRHTRTWRPQCKRVRIARGYAWTSGRMILWEWKFLEDFDFWHQETGVGKFWTGLDPSHKLTATGTAGGAGITPEFLSMDPS